MSFSLGLELITEVLLNKGVSPCYASVCSSVKWVSLGKNKVRKWEGGVGDGHEALKL